MPSRGGMSRARRYRIVGIVAVAMLACFVTLTACSNQPEGDRCQTENGNADCADGLVCLASGQKAFNGGVGYVNSPYNNSDRCCPLDRSKATHPACVPLVTSGVADGAVEGGETGPTGDSGPSGTVDAADASADGAGGG